MGIEHITYYINHRRVSEKDSKKTVEQEGYAAYRENYDVPSRWVSLDEMSIEDALADVAKALYSKQGVYDMRIITDQKYPEPSTLQKTGRISTIDNRRPLTEEEKIFWDALFALNRE